MRFLWLALCAIGSYLIGSLNPSYIISRIKGFDIREAGSGNAGGSNAMLTMGKHIGVICMILDIFKAFIVVKVSMILLPDDPLAGAVATTAVILGHMFPVFLHFKGGKGLACLGGSLLAYSPAVAMIFLAIELIFVFIADYIVIVPVTASIAFPLVYYLRGGPLPGALIIAIATVAMLYKHHENFVRIKAGKEAHFSYIWKKDKEVERIKNNMSDEEYNSIQIKKDK